MNLSRIKTDIKLNEFLFGLAFYPWLIAWLFTSTFYKDILHPYGIIRSWEYLGLFFLLIKFILSRVKIKTLLFTLIVLCIGFIVSYDNGNASFVAYTVALIFSAKDINFYNLIKNTMFCQIIILVLVIVSAIIGIIPNEVNLTYSGGLFRLRYGLGFTYTSFTPNFFLSILLEYTYLKGEKLWTVFELSVFVLLNVIIYRYTETRLTFIMTFIVLLIALLRRVIKITINFKYFKFIIILIYPIMAFFTYWMTVRFDYGNRFFSTINNLLSQRLRFGQEGLRSYPPSLFGTHIQWDTSLNSYFYVDSSYINMLISYGLLIFSLTLLGYCAVMSKILISKNTSLLVILIFWSIRACIDPQLFLLWFNPFLFLMAKVISGKGEDNDITYLRI